MGIDAQHEAVLHASPGDLAARLEPRITETVGNGGVVVAALDGEHADALRSVLGVAADDVEFVDPALAHGVPAFTVATRWARTVRRGKPALVVGQFLPGLPGCGPAHWARLDIALNVVLAGLPVTVLCAWSTSSPDLARMRATHPCVDGRASLGYRPPRDALVDHPPPPPPDLGAPAARVRFGADDLAGLRRRVAALAVTAGMDAERVPDVVLAVNEIASNSVEHGPGVGVLSVWDDGTDLVAEVADTGGGMDMPFPGLVLPPSDGARGRGLWLASELSDVLEVWSDDDGTVVRVRVRY